MHCWSTGKPASSGSTIFERKGNIFIQCVIKVNIFSNYFRRRLTQILGIDLVEWERFLSTKVKIEKLKQTFMTNVLTLTICRLQLGQLYWIFSFINNQGIILWSPFSVRKCINTEGNENRNKWKYVPFFMKKVGTPLWKHYIIIITFRK